MSSTKPPPTKSAATAGQISSHGWGRTKPKPFRRKGGAQLLPQNNRPLSRFPVALKRGGPKRGTQSQFCTKRGSKACRHLRTENTFLTPFISQRWRTRAWVCSPPRDHLPEMAHLRKHTLLKTNLPEMAHLRSLSTNHWHTQLQCTATAGLEERLFSPELINANHWYTQLQCTATAGLVNIDS